MLSKKQEHVCVSRAPAALNMLALLDFTPAQAPPHMARFVNSISCSFPSVHVREACVNVKLSAFSFLEVKSSLGQFLDDLLTIDNSPPTQLVARMVEIACDAPHAEMETSRRIFQLLVEAISRQSSALVGLAYRLGELMKRIPGLTVGYPQLQKVLHNMVHSSRYLANAATNIDNVTARIRVSVHSHTAGWLTFRVSNTALTLFSDVAAFLSRGERIVNGWCYIVAGASSSVLHFDRLSGMARNTTATREKLLIEFRAFQKAASAKSASAHTRLLSSFKTIVTAGSVVSVTTRTPLSPAEKLSITLQSSCTLPAALDTRPTDIPKPNFSRSTADVIAPWLQRSRDMNLVQVVWMDILTSPKCPCGYPQLAPKDQAHHGARALCPACSSWVCLVCERAVPEGDGSSLTGRAPMFPSKPSTCTTYDSRGGSGGPFATSGTVPPSNFGFDSRWSKADEPAWFFQVPVDLPETFSSFRCVAGIQGHHPAQDREPPTGHDWGPNDPFLINDLSFDCSWVTQAAISIKNAFPSDSLLGETFIGADGAAIASAIADNRLEQEYGPGKPRATAKNSSISFCPKSFTELSVASTDFPVDPDDAQFALQVRRMYRRISSLLFVVGETCVLAALDGIDARGLSNPTVIMPGSKAMREWVRELSRFRQRDCGATITVPPELILSRQDELTHMLRLCKKSPATYFYQHAVERPVFDCGTRDEPAWESGMI